MAELRWHPLIEDWVIVASHRQARPQMPADYCPFCPGSGRVPESYEVLKYDNDFPALSTNPPPPDPVATDFFRTAPAYGRCEVILYSPCHTAHLYDLSAAQLETLVELWCQRYTAMAADPDIAYVFIFENRGEAVGVTMPHPHGQIYGYSKLPKKIALELAAAQKHHHITGRCLFCDLLENEQKEQSRVIFSNRHFTVVLPFFTEYPYGVYVFANRHLGDITQLDPQERRALGETLRQVAGMYDSLFDSVFPYMMCMHNAPCRQDASQEYHLHIEFFPPMRAADRQKFNASSETGAWAHCNPTCPEEKAEELRLAHARFLAKQQG